MVFELIDLFDVFKVRGYPEWLRLKTYGSSSDAANTITDVLRKRLPDRIWPDSHREAFMLGTSNTKHEKGGFDIFNTTTPIPDLNAKFKLWMVLEIVSGQRNRGFSHVEHNTNLIGHAWRMHSEIRTMKLIDTALA
ncbi:hypothetical protein CTI12_AA370290 [Artemisia annua]|uniref:Uncharacterized protein n=1 Tax=Artemisia annua TaxID=35608 RepID=A0A2U1MK27_ARTAN|nr:hypothetical protein CTI12_AA370290 [Artemisia annua]